MKMQTHGVWKCKPIVHMKMQIYDMYIYIYNIQHYSSSSLHLRSSLVQSRIYMYIYIYIYINTTLQLIIITVTYIIYTYTYMYIHHYSSSSLPLRVCISWWQLMPGNYSHHSLHVRRYIGHYTYVNTFIVTLTL